MTDFYYAYYIHFIVIFAILLFIVQMFEMTTKIRCQSTTKYSPNKSSLKILHIYIATEQGAQCLRNLWF